MNSAAHHIQAISVRNLQRTVKADVAELEAFARQALRICLNIKCGGVTDLEKAREISVLIVSDRRMESLHRKFLNEAGTTDVLTFQHGEIFISAETARRNTRRFGTNLRTELCLYVVHGLLHLHGFDDREPNAKKRMEALQSEIFERAAV